MKIKYESPSIKKVKLVPSEAVLQSCKTASQAGPVFTGCTGNISSCAEQGS